MSQSRTLSIFVPSGSDNSPIEMITEGNWNFFKSNEGMASSKMKEIFSSHTSKIMENAYYPSGPLETLFIRLTATYLLVNGDSEETKKKAGDMIKRTSTNPADYARLCQFSKSVKAWIDLEVSHTKTECNYVLTFQRESEVESSHYIATYITMDNRCYFVEQTPAVPDFYQKLLGGK